MRELANATSELKKANSRRTLPEGGLPPRIPTPQTCRQCAVKDGVWKREPYFCEVLDRHNTCLHSNKRHLPRTTDTDP